MMHASKVLFLALSVTFFIFLYFLVCFFLFLTQISRELLNGFARKFTGKTCLVPHSDEFERQMQKSKIKITRDKKRT